MGKLKKKIKNALVSVGVATAMMLPPADPVNAMPAPALEPSASMITFDPSQEQFFKDDARVIIVNWHRQKGKDFVAAAKAVDHAIRTGQTWYIVSLTQRQADATFEKCKKVAEAFKKLFRLTGNIESSEEKFLDHDKAIDEMFVYTSRTLTLPNGGKVVSLPGKNPDTLAGLTGNVIFTEFGLFPRGGYDHWRVVFPLTTRGYIVIVISTPRSKKTKFFELFSDPGTYSVHFCDLVHSVECDGFVLKDNKGNACSLDEFKKIYGDDAGWQREYLCQFTGDLDALITWAQLLSARDPELKTQILRIENGNGWQTSFFDFIKPLSPGRLEMGWDVAAKQHLSPLWVNLAGRDGKKNMVALVIMHGCEFALMREVITAAMNSRAGSVGCGDATGLGMESNQVLSTRYRDRWEGVVFNTKTKSDLGSLGRTAFGDNAQRLPDFTTDTSYKFIATDLYSLQYQPSDDAADKRLMLSETENELEPNSHCDIAYSGLLALRAGTMRGGRNAPGQRYAFTKPEGW